MKPLVLFLSVMLVGCGANAPAPQRDLVVATIEIVDEFEDDRLAEAKTFNGVCQIRIRRDVYPNCVTHEVMHCFSGNWHKGYETTDYCYVR